MKRRQSKARAFLAAILAVMLIGALLAGCGKGNNENKEPGANNAANDKNNSTPEPEPEEPVEITWLSISPPEKDDNVIQQYLENRFNVKIKNMRIDAATWQEQLNIKLAAGEIPDVFWLFFDTNILAQDVQQGVLAEMPVDEIKANMPKYAQTVDQVSPELWKYANVDGKNYGIPIYWKLGGMPFLPGYNSKWLKAIGYNEPPKTLAEFEDVLTKFRNNDPDGNGKKDTYGYSGYGADSRSFNAVFAAFQVSPQLWEVDKSGKLAFGMTTEGARQAFKVINKWYKAGLINPEAITKKIPDAQTDFINNKVGIIDWMSYQFTPKNGIIGSKFAAANPDNSIAVGKPLAGPDGAGKAFSYGVMNGMVGMGKNVDEKKRKKIYEILEALATDDEAYLTSYFGIEGQQYDMVAGKPVLKPEFGSQVERAKMGAGTYYGIFGNKSVAMEKYDFTAEEDQQINEMRTGVETLIQRKYFKVDAETKYPDLVKLRDEYFIKFVIGDVDLDKGFDDFVALWMKSGGQEMTDQVNAYYSSVK